jgi:hypothetical protein
MRTVEADGSETQIIWWDADFNIIHDLGDVHRAVAGREARFNAAGVLIEHTVFVMELDPEPER